MQHNILSYLQFNINKKEATVDLLTLVKIFEGSLKILKDSSKIFLRIFFSNPQGSYLGSLKILKDLSVSCQDPQRSLPRSSRILEDPRRSCPRSLRIFEDPVQDPVQDPQGFLKILTKIFEDHQRSLRMLKEPTKDPWGSSKTISKILKDLQRSGARSLRIFKNPCQDHAQDP